MSDHHAGTGSLQDFHDFLGFTRGNYGIFSRGPLRHFSLAGDDYKFVPVLSPSSRSASVVPYAFLFTGTAILEISENLRRRHLASTLNVCTRDK